MKFFKRTIKDVPLENQTVLLRADYNVPLNKDGSVKDDFRIRASLPTVRYLLKRGCKVVIIAHLGRPEGKDLKLSLEPAAQRLAELLGEPVRFVDQTIGEKARMAVKRAPKKGVIVLENLRFHEQEEANDEQFARELAKTSGAHYFVQDGFGVVHRDHASTAAITLQLPSVAGLLLEKEYVSIVSSMKQPKRPLVAVMGGAKVSDKIQVVDELVNVADRILIGGAMANTFFAAAGEPIGKSKHEDNQTETIKSIYRAIQAKDSVNQSEFLVLPTDVAVTTELTDSATRTLKLVGEVAEDDIILDIGDQTAKLFTQIIQNAGTVIWNGTLGYAESPTFANGSEAIASALASNPKIDSIIGGGDTADFVIHWDSKKGDSFTHVSTGGGASLELMAGEKLPGVEHLLDA